MTKDSLNKSKKRKWAEQYQKDHEMTHEDANSLIEASGFSPPSFQQAVLD